MYILLMLGAIVLQGWQSLNLAAAHIRARVVCTSSEWTISLLDWLKAPTWSELFRKRCVLGIMGANIAEWSLPLMLTPVLLANHSNTFVRPGKSSCYRHRITYTIVSSEYPGSYHYYCWITFLPCSCLLSRKSVGTRLTIEVINVDQLSEIGTG